MILYGFLSCIWYSADLTPFSDMTSYLGIKIVQT